MVIDQVFQILEENTKEKKKAKLLKQKELVKAKFKAEDLSQNRKTTIILSRDLIERIARLGTKGETYDNIINGIIDFDITLEKSQKRK